MPARLYLLVPVATVTGALAATRLPATGAVVVALLVGGVAGDLLRRAGQSRLGRRAATVESRLAELSAERGRVERLLDHLPLAVLLFDAAGLVYGNPAARALFPAAEHGRTAREALGLTALAEAVSEAREGRAPVELEVDRAGRELAARASSITGDEVALVVTDLTDARRVEAMRRDFVLNASHELKTPVAGIQALTESLELAVDRDPVRARRMIDRLHVEATRLSQLVRELLDLARVEDAVARGNLGRVDVAEVVRAQIERVTGLAAQRRVEIDCDGAPSAPVVAVPEDIRLIAGNLLDNAVAYNREGGRVTVTVRQLPGEVVLEVADTGIGIADADRERVFERFYRVDKARSRAVGGGTGLGLSLVRHAARRHGGRVSVDSTLGEGSVFRVVLPVAGSGA